MTSYSFDKNGNLSTITYPTGRTVDYALDAVDRTTTVKTTKGATTTTLASGISHKPYGGVAAMTYGNGLARSVAYDQQYRITGIQTGAVQNVSYTHDPNGNITAITNILNPTKNKSFGYDALDRLTSATGPWGSLSWTYDPVGNRQTQVENGATSTYSYQSGTNRLQSVSGPSPLSFSLDANGNTTTENAKTFTFNQNNRLIKAADSGTTKGQYTFNASGQRATKKAGSLTRVFHHDQSGNLIAETTSAGATVAEYIHLDGQPLAKADTGGTRFVHPDHLGTPQVMTGSTGAVVWQIESKPFGDGASITGTAFLNLRFPGQYYDSETGLHQNWFRDYMPGVGRYLEADPIGQFVDIALFRYAKNNPIRKSDRYGLLEQIVFSGDDDPIVSGPVAQPTIMAGGQLNGAWGLGGGSVTLGVTANTSFQACVFVQVCYRVGYGYFAGAGIVGGLGLSFPGQSPDPDLSLGVGADAGAGPAIGGQVTVISGSGPSIAKGLKPGVGYGFSGGMDVCVMRQKCTPTCPPPKTVQQN